MSESIRERDLSLVEAAPTDELRALREGRPVRIPATSLPIPSAVESRLSDLEAGQAVGQIVARTWSELSGMTGSVGAGAQVISDAGTHTDPVVGGTVANAGQYVWSASPAGWRWVRADALPLKADATALAAETATRGLLAARTEGVTEAWRKPNLFLDSFYSRIATETGTSSAQGSFSGTASSAALSADASGRPAVRITTAGAQRYWRAPLTYLGMVVGDKVSASVRIFDKTGSGTNGRLLVRTLNASNTEVARAEVAIPNIGTAEFVASVSAFEIGSGATQIEFSVQAATGTGAALSFTDALLAKGDSAAYRAPVGELGFAQQSAVTTLDLAVQLAFAAPNVVDNDWSKTVLLGTGAATRVPEVRNGYSAVRVDRTTGAEWFIRYPREMFGTHFSVSAILVDATNTSRRLMVMQRNSGAEIADTRVTLQPATNAGNPQRVAADNVEIHASCTHLDLYISGGGSGSGTSAWWANVTLATGASSQYRPYTGIKPAAGLVYVGPTGSDGNIGTRSLPFATPNAALRALNGVGVLAVLPGTYGSSFVIDPALVKDVQVIGLWQSGAFPLIRCTTKLTGITKTSGRTKIYQADVPGLSLANLNWVWQDGVPDARTLISIGDREPQHRGRTHRLPITKIVKATDTSSLANALTEMDGASDSRCYYDGTTLYFTVAGGGDGAAADVYVPVNSGIVTAANIGTGGRLDIQGLEVRYGNVNLRGPFSSYVDELYVYGSYENAIDYAGYLEVGTVECGGFGSLSGSVGDGLNGHSWSVLQGRDFYCHDGRDEGESAHEYGTVRLNGGLSEFNLGGGVAPANGCDAVYRNVRTRGNGAAGFKTVNAPTDGGVDTRALFDGCVSINDANGFRGDPANSCYAEAVNCKVYGTSGTGYQQMVIRDCGYSGSGTAKGSGVTVSNTALVT